MSWEREKIGHIVEDCFGYRALQIGLPGIDFLACNRMPSHICTVAEWERPDCPDAGACSSALVYAEGDALPFFSEELDLVVLPHALDFSGSILWARHVLREASRVLIPGGRLVITAFNPGSLWGIWQKAERIFHNGSFLPSRSVLVALPRLRDWCSLLSLEIDRGAFGAYEPPCRSDRSMSQWHWFDQAGDRWWPSCGGVMMISAVKQVEGVRLVGKLDFAGRAFPAGRVMPVAEAAAESRLRRADRCLETELRSTDVIKRRKVQPAA